MAPSAVSAQSSGDSIDATLRFEFEVTNRFLGTLSELDFSTTYFPTTSSNPSGTFGDGTSTAVATTTPGFDHPVVPGYTFTGTQCVDTATGNPVPGNSHPFSGPDFFVVVADGDDITCTISYEDTAPATLFIDVAVDGDATSPSTSDVLLLINDEQHYGFTRLEVLSGVHTIEPVGGPGLELVGAVCGEIGTDEFVALTGPEYFAPAGSGIFCSFEFITVEVPPEAGVVISTSIDGESNTDAELMETLVNGTPFFGFAEIVVLPGQQTVEPVGAEGFELVTGACFDNQEFTPPAIEGGPSYELLEGEILFCLFDYTAAAPAQAAVEPEPVAATAATDPNDIPTLALTGVESEWAAMFGLLLVTTGVAIESSRRRPKSR